MSRLVFSLAAVVAAAAPALADPLPAAPADAAVTGYVQDPCKLVSNACAVFAGPTPAVQTVRSFPFTSKGYGPALVSFAGSISCVNDATTGGDGSGVVDLIAQIVDVETDVPDFNKPSGARFQLKLPPKTGTEPYAQAFSLNTYRLVTTTKPNTTGKVPTTTVWFKIKPNRMDAGTKCAIYSAAFSVMPLKR